MTEKISIFPPLVRGGWGGFLRFRKRSNKPASLEIAITGYNIALTVYTHENFPVDWAITQNNLGVAYSDRIKEDKAENIELAIKSSQAALEVRTRENFPVEWATTQNNLGNAYSDSIKEDKADNIELAIKSYQDALEVYTPENFPVEWAMTQNNLGAAYRDRIKEDKADNIELAIKCFQAALEVRTRETFPLECLKTAENLGNLAFKEGNWQLAIEAYTQAIEAVELSRSWATTDDRRQEILAQSIEIYANMVQCCINNNQLDLAITTVERSRSRHLVDLMASKDLYSDAEIPPEVEQLLKQYEQTQQQINQYRDSNPSEGKGEVRAATRSNRAALNAKTDIIQQLEAEKQVIYNQIRKYDQVLAGQIQVNPLDLPTLQKLIEQPSQAILSFYTTENDTYIFILRQNSITLHTCTGEGLEKLQNWIFDNWLVPYIEDKNTWLAQINSIMTQLSDRLRINELIAQHLEGIQELILIPHLYLHLLPLSILPIADENQNREKTLGDRYLIRTQTSCQILNFCFERDKKHTLTQLEYGTVEDATEDLAFSTYECEKIAEIYQIPPHNRLKWSQQATITNYKQLIAKIQTLHSSHHAQSRLDNPLESVLKLADGNITLGEILLWRYNNLNEVFLSCCETGVGMAKNRNDDILTLSAGFLCAGARAVISSLWAVDDLATALFSIFYYQQRNQEKNRPQALQAAQQDLRNLTKEELNTQYAPIIKTQLEARKNEARKAEYVAQKNLKDIPKNSPEYQQHLEERKRLNNLANKLDKSLTYLTKKCQEEQPFSHPVYWAGFVTQGLS